MNTKHNKVPQHNRKVLFWLESLSGLQNSNVMQEKSPHIVQDREMHTCHLLDYIVQEEEIAKPLALGWEKDWSS